MDCFLGEFECNILILYDIFSLIIHCLSLQIITGYVTYSLAMNHQNVIFCMLDILNKDYDFFIHFHALHLSLA